MTISEILQAFIAQYYQTKVYIASAADSSSSGTKSFIAEPAPGKSQSSESTKNQTQKAKDKFKIAKKISHSIDKICEFLAVLAEIENDIGLEFPESVIQKVEHFLDDMLTSIKSIDDSDSVAAVYSINDNKDISTASQYIYTFKGIFLNIFVNIYHEICQSIKNLITHTRDAEGYSGKTVNLLKEVLVKLISKFEHSNELHPYVEFNCKYSQDFHNPNFKEGIGATDGQPVSAVAASLRDGEIKSHELPISVFPSEKPGYMYAKNNRTLTAFSRAMLAPVRLSVILPTREEADRPKSLNSGGLVIKEEKRVENSGSQVNTPVLTPNMIKRGFAFDWSTVELSYSSSSTTSIPSAQDQGNLDLAEQKESSSNSGMVPLTPRMSPQDKLHHRENSATFKANFMPISPQSFGQKIVRLHGFFENTNSDSSSSSASATIPTPTLTLGAGKGTRSQ
jgi:hypothetical protein